LVTLDDLPARAAGASYRELEPPGVAVTPPPAWVWPPAFVPTPRHFVAARGQGVVEIPGGVVFGSRGHFGSDPNGLLADACSLWPNDERRALVESAEALAVGLEELDGVTMSVWVNGENYAHCLLQGVPRLELLRRAFGLEADRFLVNDAAPRATVEALEILGIPADRLHVVPSRGAAAYRCETLRAATSQYMRDFGIPWTAAFLNELFLPDPPDPSARRIYVRRGVSRRAVLNEEEVLTLLESSGFEAITMDGRSIGEQAAMFASAAVIVATHGAALANLVFARPGTAVIELMGTNTASGVFANLSWRRGLNYQMVMGTEPAPPRRWWAWQIDADTMVDVRGLKNCLERLALA
jgi:capsular polysaccharide biosynthesis protein